MYVHMSGAIYLSIRIINMHTIRGCREKKSALNSLVKERKNSESERRGNSQPYISQQNYARNVQLVHVPNGMYKTVC